VAIARALVNADRLLATSHRQSGRASDRGVFQLLRDINASGTAVAMATPRPRLVRQPLPDESNCRKARWCYDSAVDERAIRQPRHEPRGPEALLAFKRAPLLSALSVTTIAFSLLCWGCSGSWR